VFEHTDMELLDGEIAQLRREHATMLTGSDMAGRCGSDSAAHRRASSNEAMIWPARTGPIPGHRH
jgi:hypothetical protein